MKKIFICLLMIPLLFLLSCEDECDHLNYLGQDTSIAEFSLNRGTSEFPLEIHKDSVVLSIADDFDFSGLSAKVLLSEGAAIVPAPEAITDWSKNMEFTVTAIDKVTFKVYKYVVDKKVYEHVYDKVALLTTQAEVDAFGANKYTRVGGIIIKSIADENEKIVDLSALNTIETVDFGIHITTFYGEDLKGFENLKRVTSFEISNAMVKSIVLDNLEEVTNLLVGKLYDRPLAGMCTGLTSMSCAKLKVVRNDLALCGSFKSFEGFSNLEHVEGEVILQGNNETMKGLEKLTKLNYLSIGSRQLKTLEGLKNLRVVKKSLKFSFVGLVTLEGLNLESLGSLNINNASKLCDITALKNLTKVGNLFLSGIPRLNSLEGLHNLKSIENSISLSYVGMGTMIDATSVLVNLNGLRSLESVGGSLRLKSCEKLEDISALEKLTRLENVEIFSCSELQSLIGLHHVKNIRGTLNLQNLGKRGWGPTPTTGISNLDALSELENIGGRVTISSCPNLNDFCGISDIMSRTSIVPNISGNAYNPKIEDFQEGRCSK